MMMAWAVGSLLVFVAVTMPVVAVTLRRMAQPGMTLVISGGATNVFLTRQSCRNDQSDGQSCRDGHFHRSIQ
jgi:hypothetical protein